MEGRRRESSKEGRTEEPLPLPSIAFLSVAKPSDQGLLDVVALLVVVLGEVATTFILYHLPSLKCKFYRRFQKLPGF